MLGYHRKFLRTPEQEICFVYQARPTYRIHPWLGHESRNLAVIP